MRHVKPHPCAHEGLALAGAGQMFPHDPQFAASLVRSTQLLPQRSGVGDEHPLEHTYVPPLELHTGDSAPHT